MFHYSNISSRIKFLLLDVQGQIISKLLNNEARKLQKEVSVV